MCSRGLWQTAPMLDSSLFLILLVLLIGSYIQAVAGFALGMIAVAVIGGLRLLDIPTLAAMVSLLSMLNASLSGWLYTACAPPDADLVGCRHYSGSAVGLLVDAVFERQSAVGSGAVFGNLYYSRRFVHEHSAAQLV